MHQLGRLVGTPLDASTNARPTSRNSGLNSISNRPPIAAPRFIGTSTCAGRPTGAIDPMLLVDRTVEEAVAYAISAATAALAI